MSKLKFASRHETDEADGELWWHTIDVQEYTCEPNELHDVHICASYKKHLDSIVTRAFVGNQLSTRGALLRTGIFYIK